MKSITRYRNTGIRLPALCRQLGWLLLLLIPAGAFAQENIRQDHIVNAYFANDAVRVDGWLQPVQIIHSIRGNHPAAAALFVLNLSLTSGTHQVQAVVRGPDGVVFKTIPFSAEVVETEREPRAIWGVLRGRFPTGGITLEVLHARDGAEGQSLGRFYLHTLP